MKQFQMRPVVSKRSVYYIPKERYYELKYFCAQYPMWKDLASQAIDPNTEHTVRQKRYISDPVYISVRDRSYYLKRMNMVEEACKYSDPGGLGDYILLGVTRNLSYNTLRLKYNIPCGHNLYYQCVRTCYWILDRLRE